MAMKIMCPRCHENSYEDKLKNGACPNCNMQLITTTGNQPAKPKYFEYSGLDGVIVDLKIEDEIITQRIDEKSCILCDDFRLFEVKCPHCGQVFMNI